VNARLGTERPEVEHLAHQCRRCCELLAMTDPDQLRTHFPVLATRAYLNAGTEGPIPRAAADAVQQRLTEDLSAGRGGGTYFTTVVELAAEARAGYALALGAAPSDVALTSSTTFGVNTVLQGLKLGPGDEVITSDQEHPGVYAPLRLARVGHGVKVTVVPFTELPGEVGPNTKLIACSHVSWIGGEVVDVAALVATGVPVLLDAAQALGAIPVDVNALGVDYYAGSGQKWMCGPEGSGALYVKPSRLDELEPPMPGYGAVADAHDALGSELAAGAARLDDGFPTAMRSAWAVASMGVLSGAGWEWVHERAATLASGLASRLRERGVEVAPRGRSTLVSWKSHDPEGDVKRLAEAGIIVRSIPSAELVRASVGAWTSEDDLERLLKAVA
jgi:L-cysteine/cystine lyase